MGQKGTDFSGLVPFFILGTRFVFVFFHVVDGQYICVALSAHFQHTCLVLVFPGFGSVSLCLGIIKTV